MTRLLIAISAARSIKKIGCVTFIRSRAMGIRAVVFVRFLEMVCNGTAYQLPKHSELHAYSGGLSH